MASSKNRQRALARAKLERQIARRAATARRRRQLQAAIGASLAVLLIAVGGAWAAGAFKPDPVKPADCVWNAAQDTANPDLKDVGNPPTSGVAKSGTKPMTITTNLGVLEAELDLAKAPCTSTSVSHLAAKNFFDNTKCHRLTTGGIFVLQCGDPSATGKGGPKYTFPDENLPAAPPQPSADPNNPAPPPTNLYPRGTLAMANSGPNSNGSQFFIVYKDGSALEAKYSVFGRVTKGLELVDQVAAAGVADAGGQPSTDGTPKTEVTIQSLTVGDTAPAAPAPGGQPTPSANAASKP